jgi:predicted DNA-binding transcriptional regulator AlpA
MTVQPLTKEFSEALLDARGAATFLGVSPRVLWGLADQSSAAVATVEIGGGQVAGNERPPLIDVKEFAAKLSCCPKHIRRMADSGRCPPPIHLGGLHRWNRQVVDDWIAAGCPVVRPVRMSSRKK